MARNLLKILCGKDRALKNEGKMARNLLKNPCGEEEFKHWEEVEHGGDGWRVEELPGDCGAAFPDDGVSKCFASSFRCCSKTQVINLVKEGYQKRLLDTSPKIVVSDWYAGRTDAGCCYQLKVQLLSDSREVISEYISENITIPKTKNGAWTQSSMHNVDWIFSEQQTGFQIASQLLKDTRVTVYTLEAQEMGISHTFSGYGPRVRFIQFTHCGQDSVYWKGWYGVRVTNSSVTIEA